jgi:hypothetical protein
MSDLVVGNFVYPGWNRHWLEQNPDYEREVHTLMGRTRTFLAFSGRKQGWTIKAISPCTRIETRCATLDSAAPTMRITKLKRPGNARL